MMRGLCSVIMFNVLYGQRLNLGSLSQKYHYIMTYLEVLQVDNSTCTYKVKPITGLQPNDIFLN